MRRRPSRLTSFSPCLEGEVSARRNSCEVRVGRLVEIAVPRGYASIEDVADMERMIAQAFRSTPADQRLVLVADWRGCQLYRPEVAEAVLHMMAAVNHRLERSGVLCHPERATSVLQALRLAHDTRHPDRRVFRDPTDLQEWLGELLSAEEQRRLSDFLASGDVQ